MKLEKAIELLQLEDSLPWNMGKTDLSSAIKLSIEALEVVIAWREQHRDIGFLMLVGETEE